MLQFGVQCYEELTVAWVRTVKFISGTFFLADRSACLIYGINVGRCFFNEVSEEKDSSQDRNDYVNRKL